MADELISLVEERKRFSLRQYLDVVISSVLMISWLLLGTFIGFIWVVEWFNRGMNHLGYTCWQKEQITLEVAHEAIGHSAHLLWLGAFVIFFTYPFLLKVLDRYGGVLNEIYLRADRVAAMILLVFIIMAVRIIVHIVWGV